VQHNLTQPQSCEVEFALGLFRFINCTARVYKSIEFQTFHVLVVRSKLRHCTSRLKFSGLSNYNIYVDTVDRPQKALVIIILYTSELILNTCRVYSSHRLMFTSVKWAWMVAKSKTSLLCRTIRNFQRRSDDTSYLAQSYGIMIWYNLTQPRWFAVEYTYYLCSNISKNLSDFKRRLRWIETSVLQHSLS